MPDILNFLSNRRSITAKMMNPGHIKPEDLKHILNAGLRIPDHGGLKPWKIIVIDGDRRKIFDEEVILKEYKSNNNDATAEMIKMESTRFQRAHTIIAVLSSPVEHPKICEWEQILSAGAMCTTILYAAQSLGYASQWITEWYAYKKNVILALGGDPVKDKVAGFIYIGEKDRDPKERVRPVPKDYISYF